MTQEYFGDLNYSMANEDTQVEHLISQDLLAKKIVSISGSGSRCLPLINECTTDLFLLDYSKEQLYLAELRVQTFKHLSHQEFLKFWGYAPFSVQNHCDLRKEKFFEFELKDESREFLLQLFSKHDGNQSCILESGRKQLSHSAK